MTYNKVVHALREALLKPSGTPQTHRSVIAGIFRRIDENDSGIISVQEMRDFLLSDELRLFEEDEEATQVERVVNLLMEQLDLNR
jgi:Ca2+-binding EF-hand superfamily protein